MHIFIDESGTFARSAKAASPSVVAALVIPEGSWAKLAKKYAEHRRALPKNNAGEVKGGLLNEKQVATVAHTLSHSCSLAFAVVIDPAWYDEDVFRQHRQDFVETLTRDLKDDYPDHLKEAVKRDCAEVLAMPEQLYTQARVTWELARRLIECSIPYFAQRQPNALAAFDWAIDAKDLKVTNAEQWWRRLTSPLLEAISVEQPMALPVGLDYRFFQRFLMATPERLEPHFPTHVASRRGIDLQLIFHEKFRFSHDVEPGLEMADILANATRRALVGNLRAEGWNSFAEMMLPKWGFQLLSLAPNQAATHLPLEPAARRFLAGGRNMITRHTRDS
jgi:hypothetical protein